jgi:hypothetical protein
MHETPRFPGLPRRVDVVRGPDREHHSHCGSEDPPAVIIAAQRSGRRFFVGVNLSKGERRDAETKWNEAAAEIVATVYRERR